MSKVKYTTKDGIVIDVTPELVEEYILKSQYDQALAMCSSLIMNSSGGESNPKLLYLKAKIELGCRNFSAALKTVKSINPESYDADILVVKSQIEMYTGQHLDSLESANLALEYDATRIGAYVCKASALRHLHQDKAASSVLDTAVENVAYTHGVRSVKGDIEKAFLARLCQKYDIAIKYAQYVIDQAPEYASGYVHLGTNYLLKFMSSAVSSGSSTEVDFAAAAAAGGAGKETSRLDYTSAGGGGGGGGGAAGAAAAAAALAGVSHEVVEDGLFTDRRSERSLSASFDAETVSLYTKAIVALSKALELNPFDSVAMFYMGVAEEAMGHQDQAMAHYEASAKTSPEYANAVLALAKLHMQQDNEDSALGHIQDLVKINPSEEALLAHAKALESADDYSTALEVLSKLIEMNPANHYYHYRQALVYNAVGEYTDAIAACNKAIALNPDDLFVRTQLALNYCSQGNYKEAMDIVRKVTTSHPDFAEGYKTKAIVLSEMAANSDVSFIYHYSNLSASQRSEGVSKLIAENKVSEAAMWFYNGVDESRDHCLIYMQEALDQREAGDIPKAISYLTQAIQVNPDFIMAKKLLAEIYGESSPALAAHLMKEVTDTPYGVGLLDTSKQPHVLHVQKSSIKAFDNAIRLDPKNPTIHSAKASALGQFNMLDEMLKATETAEILMSHDTGATLAPDRVEYIMQQNKIKIALLKEIRKVAQEAEALYSKSAQATLPAYSLVTASSSGMGSKHEDDGFTSEHTSRSSSTATIPHLETLATRAASDGVAKNFMSACASRPSTGDIMGMERSASLEAVASLASPVPTIVPRHHDSPGTAVRRLPSIDAREANAASFAGTLASTRTASSGESHFAMVDTSYAKMIANKVALLNKAVAIDDVTDTTVHIFAVAGHDDARAVPAGYSPSVTVATTSPAKAGVPASRGLVNDGPLAMGGCGASSVASSPMASGYADNMSITISASPMATVAVVATAAPSPVDCAIDVHCGSDTKTGGAAAAAAALPEAESEAKVAFKTVAMNIQVALKAAANNAKIAALRTELEQMKETQLMLAHMTAPILEREAQHKAWVDEASKVDGDIFLAQYRDGFTKTIQKFLVGALAHSSGMVAEKKFEIPGLEYIPLPPVASQIVKALHTCGGMVLRVREDNQITTALSGISNPLHFATYLSTKIACKLALLSPEKTAIIQNGTHEPKHGIFKIAALYNYLKSTVWLEENITYAAQVGAEDAFKVIAMLRAGNLNISASTEHDAENIDRVVAAYRAVTYTREVTEDDVATPAPDITPAPSAIVAAVLATPAAGESPVLRDDPTSCILSPKAVLTPGVSTPDPASARAVASVAASVDPAKRGDEEHVTASPSAISANSAKCTCDSVTSASTARSSAATVNGENIHVARTWAAWFSYIFHGCTTTATVDETAHIQIDVTKPALIPPLGAESIVSEAPD